MGPRSAVLCERHRAKDLGVRDLGQRGAIEILAFEGGMRDSIDERLSAAGSGPNADREPIAGSWAGIEVLVREALVKLRLSRRHVDWRFAAEHETLDSAYDVNDARNVRLRVDDVAGWLRETDVADVDGAGRKTLNSAGVELLDDLGSRERIRIGSGGRGRPTCNQKSSECGQPQ